MTPHELQAALREARRRLLNATAVLDVRAAELRRIGDTAGVDALLDVRLALTGGTP